MRKSGLGYVKTSVNDLIDAWWSIVVVTFSVYKHTPSLFHDDDGDQSPVFFFLLLPLILSKKLHDGLVTRAHDGSNHIDGIR